MDRHYVQLYYALLVIIWDHIVSAASLRILVSVTTFVDTAISHELTF